MAVIGFSVCLFHNFIFLNFKIMEKIIIKTLVSKPAAEVWEYFTKPEHITHWNFATEDWSCPVAQSDLREGGKFSFTMEAKDRSLSFDFTGTFREIKENECLKYTLDDGRQVEVIFTETVNGQTEVTESFDPESQNPAEMQQQGWTLIMNNFKSYSEAQ